MTEVGVGDERALLGGTLAMLREAVLHKAAGLTEEQGRWTPDGALIPLVGIVNHLAHVEWRWIDGVFLGAEVSRSEEEFVARSVTLEQAVENYRTRGRATDEAIRNAPSLDERGVGRHGPERDLRWILVHLIQETARHAGHADATRELLDGLTGE
jgi:uncharacterized damage-inducible protein DinB